MSSSTAPYNSMFMKLQKCSCLAAMLVAVFCFLVSFGWIFDISFLKRPIPEGGTITFGAAVACLILAASVLILRWRDSLDGRVVSRKICTSSCFALGVFVFFIATLKFMEVLLQADWGIGFSFEVPFPDRLPLSLPGQFSMDVSLLLMLYGFSVALSCFDLSVRNWKPYQLASLSGAAISLLPVLGYVSGHESLCTLYGCIKMPVILGMVSLVLCFAILFRRLEGPLLIFSSDTASGASSRSLLVLLYVVCPLVLFLQVVCINFLGFDKGLASTTGLAVLIVSAMWQMWSASRTVVDEEQRRREIEQQLQQEEDKLRKTTERLQKTEDALSETVRSKAQMEPETDTGVQVRFVCPACGSVFDQVLEKCPIDGADLECEVKDALIGVCFAEKYNITEQIGAGGMGSVYKARHKLLQKDFAIKLLHVHMMKDVESVKRFYHEGKTLSRLQHPNIMSMTDFGLFRGQPYIVMEFLSGTSLDKLLEKRGTIPLPVFFDICLQICDALAHAHSQHVAHRDLKPANIVLFRDTSGRDFVKIVDFGLAKLIATAPDATKITQTGDVMGSPKYMSPEQVEACDIDHRCDIYSFGCVMYECLTGTVPISGKTILEMLANIASVAPAPFPGRFQIPDNLQQVIFQCLQKNPVKRPQTMVELKHKLEIVRDSILVKSKDK